MIELTPFHNNTCMRLLFVKKHISYACIFLLLVSLCSCSDNNSDKVKQEDRVHLGIVLIIQDSVQSDTFKKQQARIKYIDDTLIPHTIVLDSVKAGEELVISTQRDWMEVAYQDKNLITQSFLFKLGDTLLFMRQDSNPSFKILNRKTRSFDINYNRKRNEQLYGGKSSFLEDYYRLWHLTNSGFSVVRGYEMSDDLQELKDKAYKSLVAENQFLDWLLNEQLISEKVAKFYHLKNAFESKKLKLYQADHIDFSDTTLIKEILSEKNSLADGTQQPLSYVFYDDLLFSLYHRSLLNKLRSTSPSMINSLYDTIRSMTFLSQDAKKSLLLKHMEYIIYIFPVEDTKQAIQRFQADFPNPAWKDYLQDKFKVEKASSSNDSKPCYDGVDVCQYNVIAFHTV